LSTPLVTAPTSEIICFYLKRLGVPLFPSGNEGFDSALKDATLKKDTALAFKALNTNISPKPHYLPFITAAGMFLLEANHITHLYLHNHSHASTS